MNEFYAAWQRVFDSLRQATEFKQEDWETIGGAASQIRKAERADNSRSRGVGDHTGVSRESSDRGRANAKANAKRKKT